MRTLLFGIALSIIAVSVQAQPVAPADSTEPIRMEYERLDQIQKSTSTLLTGTIGQVTFSRVRL